MFRLLLDAIVVAQRLTGAQAHLLVGEILERIEPPQLVEMSKKARRRSQPALARAAAEDAPAKSIGSR